jgi:hypothetical protein
MTAPTVKDHSGSFSTGKSEVIPVLKYHVRDVSGSGDKFHTFLAQILGAGW